MSKVNIKTILNNKKSNEKIEHSLIGIKTNNKINYLEDKINVSIEYSDKVRITRKDSDKEIILEFKEKTNTNGLYKIYNNTYKLNIYTNKIEIKDNYIEIDYIIEDDNINYKLFVEGEI